jgi:hypothetical protein
MAGPYLHTVRAIGSSPADTAAEIAAADPTSRAAADSVLLALEVSRAVPLIERAPPLAGAPAILALSGGTQVQHGGCVLLAPPSGGTVTGVFALPVSGADVSDRGNGPTSMALKRFGDSFNHISPTVNPHSAVALSVPRDSNSLPWQVQVSSPSLISICRLLG